MGVVVEFGGRREYLNKFLLFLVDVSFFEDMIYRII